MDDTSPPKRAPRVPLAVSGIQVNFCKNPRCMNFGRPASPDVQSRGRGAMDGNQDTYRILGASRKRTNLGCNLCGETPPLKSNLAISEELIRLSRYLEPNQIPSCPAESCPNHSVNILVPKAYYSFGKTKSGSQRYRCRECGVTFAVGGATIRQKRPEINETVFKFLVNKMPMNRIMEVAGISASTLYGKIDFIHQQCLSFVASHERRFPDLPIRRLYLSVDRQDHMLNWKAANDKRNVILSAVGCADNKTGYVFGIHVNYDASLNAERVEREALEFGDNSQRTPFRRYARVWLAQDYMESLEKNVKLKAAKRRLRDNIQAEYDDSVDREDIEASEAQTFETGLPYAGMQVHSEYTMYAHFLLLKRLLGNVEKVRFFLDQDSGIRAACLSAFWPDILEKRCDAFYVRVNNRLTVNMKRRLKADSNKELDAFRATSSAYTDLTDRELRHVVIKERLQELVNIGKWNDRWLFYPFPDMSEPEKAICWLTDLQDHSYDADHLAWLYSKGTLHGIDRFFMQTRRRLSLLERPISSASGEGRKWYGYNPYNPAMVGKMLDIFRVFYNYIEAGKDKMTPAMRMGLMSSPSVYINVLETT